MKLFKIICLTCCLLIVSYSRGSVRTDTLFVAFWNLENLFDTIDDPAKNDEEFLPDGNKEWTQERFNNKIYNLARVIRAMNKNRGPDILGVCEVENKDVLDSLSQKFLHDLNYNIVHVESPDKRGIDVALLYRQSKFSVEGITVDTVHLADGWPTRPVLGVHLQNIYKQNFTVFVNHWPSRSGGEVKSEPNRIEAAITLRKAIGKIQEDDSSAFIISLGDYNDEPADKSILEFLNVKSFMCDSISSKKNFETNNKLYNLAYEEFEKGNGTYKYKDDWNMLDQVIVSRSVIMDNNFNYICKSFKIYKPYFLQTYSGYFKGTAFPTYGGRKYLGGYSDHYPVTAKFLIKGN